ncbi:tetratricopeptide repeat protein [Actinosynnema sp. NPDC023587]|uniref:tetratricopeptide repeat protein n=1 Tax=Actinosynnema sp. NPDC023587 TaxID=3154695 RepID=UPI0033FEE2A8
MTATGRSFRGYGGANRSRLHDAVRRSFDRSARGTDDDAPEDVLQAMVNDLDNVGRYDVRIDDPVLVRFVDRLTELAISAIEQGDRPGVADFPGVMRSAASLLASAGRSTWPAHVAKASYYARVAQGDELRRAELHQAVGACRTPLDRVEVDLVRAQFAIDTTEYPAASRLLARCLDTCTTDPDCRPRLPQVYVCLGNLHYVQGGLRTALGHYQAALAVDVPADSHRTTRVRARAHHYSGRIRHMLGRDEEALRDLVTALDYRYATHAEYERKSGFYHIAIGEVLVVGGAYDQAEAHFAVARRTFARLRNNTGAHAILDAAVSRLEVRRGRYDEALTLVDSAVRGAREGGYRRGALLFELHRANLLVRRRAFGAAARSVLVALGVWLRFLRRGNGLRAVRGAVEYAWAFVRQRAETRDRPHRRPLTCPCGAHG